MAVKKITAKQLQNKNLDTGVIVGGREYQLSFNFGVMGELEDIYGDIMTAIEKLQKGNIRATTNWIYAVMKQEDGNESLTIREVGKMLDLSFMDQIRGKVGKAMANSFGEGEEKEETGEK